MCARILVRMAKRIPWHNVIEPLQTAARWRAAACALEAGEILEYRGTKSAAAAWRRAARSEAAAARNFGEYLRQWAADRDARARDQARAAAAPPRVRKRLGRPPGTGKPRRKG